MLQYNPTVSGSLTITGSLTVTNGVIGTVSGVDVQIFSSSINQVISGIQSSTESSDARLSFIETFTSSALTRLTNIESKSASVDISISNINSVTASNIARLSNLETKSSSVDISISNINSFTSSNDTKFTTLGTYTGSLDTKNTTLADVTSSLISKTGSYATTGSNSFYGTQVFSGSVFIANDLIVQGSSSIQYISASSVSIGTNIVQLNTANPSVRYAGLSIIDSGSVGGSGSFLYDSVQDEFIFVHRGNGTNVTSSHFVLGPETFDNLGNETYLTCNVLTKGTGKEHLVDSSIFDNGTTVCVNSTLKASGQICSLMGNFGCIGIGTTSPKTYASITSCGQIISLNNIGIDVGQSYRLNNYYNVGTATDRTISAGLAASIGLEQSGGAIVFNISSTCAAADTTISSTERMRITCTGNVGIGTNYPRYNLVVGCDLGELSTNSTTTVVGNTASSSYLVVGQGYNRNAQFNWQYCATAACAYGQLVTYNYSNPILIDACKVILQSQSAGFVGIGTCTPADILDVRKNQNATTNFYFRNTDTTDAQSRAYLNVIAGNSSISLLALHNDNVFIAGTSGKDMYFQQSQGGTVNMTIKCDGKVGIGRPDPTSLLEISGVGDTTLTIRTTNSSNPRLKFSGGAGVFNRASSSDTMFFGETADSGNYNFRGGNVHPGANGTQDLGTASLRWNTVYTSDLSLSNGIGDYTIVEGEDDLFLYNNKQCKVYKFMLQQICAECATPKKS